MSHTYSGNRFNVVLGRVIQYLLGEDTFSGRVSSRDHFTFKLWQGRRGRSSRPPRRGRLGRSAAHRSFLFCFIHEGRCFDLFQGALRGVGGC